MPSVGITGGIATGKSTLAAALLRHLPAELFDADQAARDLLVQDAGVRAAVQATFGAEIYDPTGKPDRARLRELVFSNPARRQQLEAILHPVIRARWAARAEAARREESWLCVDIPLLYETGAEKLFDHVIVVACSAATQQRRLREVRGLDAALAEKIIASQLDLVTKIKKADHVIWNDSTPACLERQAAFLARWLRARP